MYISGFTCRLGSGAVLATANGVCRVLLPGDEDLCDVFTKYNEESDLARSAAEQLQKYFRKELQKFELRTDLQDISVFRQKVLFQASRIPYGSVVTYGQLAVQIGCRGAARAVGGALAANPLPVIIPCHRVIAASGSLTGFSAYGGVQTKRFLLDLESC